MSELITKLNPALVMEAMQAPAMIYKKDSIEQLQDGEYKSHIYDLNTGIGIIIFHDSRPVNRFTNSSIREVQLLNITSIGYAAFAYCRSLISVTIGDSVTSIETLAFKGCTSLKSVTIPNSVTSIGQEAFHGCTSLKSVTIGNGVTSIGYLAFYNCTGELTVNCNIPSASSSDKGAFYFSNFTKVTIGDSVTSIGKYAFRDCSSLTSITIGNSVTEIGDSAFSNCRSLTSVIIPDSVTKIEDFVFWECGNLKDVVIPDSVTKIGECAFFECGLTSVTIPKHVTYISDGAFNTCSQLSTIYCKASTPPDTVEDAGCLPYNSNLKIYIPINSLESYKNHEYWKHRVDALIETVFEDEVLESGTNIKTIGGQSILGEGDISFVQHITYADLRDLVEMGKLTPGQLYRITDYVTTTTQANTQATGYQFDLIVQAVDSSILSSEAKAVKHPGTTYFDNWDLGKWEIKYDIRNDQKLYKWSESDPVHRVTSQAGPISTGCALLPYSQTVEVDGKTKYLYKPTNISNRLTSEDWYERKLGKSDNIATLEEVYIVTATNDINEDNYFDVELLAMKPDGTIVRSWLADEYYSNDNLGFTGEYIMLDMYLTGNTVVINGETYYTWYCWEDYDLRQELAHGEIVFYTGSLDSLYYAFDEPLEISDQSYTKTVNEVYDINTDEIYNLLYTYDYDMGYEYISAIDEVVYTPPTSLNGKGVIYYMKDEFGNEAPFDFYTILIRYSDNDSYSIFNLNDTTLHTFGNIITTDTSTIPLVVFRQESLDNKVHVTSETNQIQVFTNPCLRNNIVIDMPFRDSTYIKYTSSTYNNCTITIKGIGSVGSSNQTFNNCTLGWGSGSIYLGSSTSVLYNSQLETDSGSCRIDLPAGNAYNLRVTVPNGISNADMTISSDILTDPSNHYTIFYAGGALQLRHDFRKGFVETFSGNTIILKEGIYYLQSSPTSSLVIKTRYTNNKGCEYFCEFTTASSGTTIALPAWVSWKNGIIPTFEPSTLYFLHIIGDKASCTPCYADPTMLQLQYTSSTNNSLSGISNIVSSNSLVSNEYDGVGIATFSKPIKTINLGYSSSHSDVKTLALPDSVETISTSFSNYYKSLTDITLGNNVKSCNTLNNKGVTNLKVHIPNLEAWLPINFSSQSLYSGHRLYINGAAVEGELTIPTSVTQIGSYNLAGYTGFTSITLPSHVTDLGSSALSGFNGILTIASQKLLNKCPSLGNGGWSSVRPTEIVFKNPITEIPNSFLYSASSVTNITLPSSLKTLGAYNIPDSLVTLTVPYLSSSDIDAPSLSSWSKDDWKSIILQSPSSWFAFNLNSNLWNSNQDFPILKKSDGTTITHLDCYRAKISDYSLACNKHITSVNAQSVREIGKRAFDNSAIQSIQLSMNLRTIKEHAFSSSSLRSINLPYGLEYIGSHAFSYTNLGSVTIPGTVTNIESSAFFTLNNLTVYCESAVPPTLGTNVFYSGSYLKTIYVPTQSVNIYKNAPQWSAYASKIKGYDVVQKFVFDIDGNPYLCEEGMTWRDWVTSTYANDMFTVGDEYVYYDGKSLTYEVCEEQTDGEETWEDCWSEEVTPDSIIDKEKTYWLY